jgi:hypothetical protein
MKNYVNDTLKLRVANQPKKGGFVVWTSLGPLPRWVPEPTTRWALGLPDLCRTAPDGVRRKYYSGEVLG